MRSAVITEIDCGVSMMGVSVLVPVALRRATIALHAAGGAVFAVGHHRDRRQGRCACRASRGRRGLDDRGVALHGGAQAGAGQQPVQRLARREAARDGRRGLARHQALLHHQLDARLPRPVVQRLGQRLRGDGDLLGRALALGLGQQRRARQGERNGQGQRRRRRLQTVHEKVRPVSK
jgi:hypothetical protein